MNLGELGMGGELDEGVPSAPLTFLPQQEGVEAQVVDGQV